MKALYLLLIIGVCSCSSNNADTSNYLIIEDASIVDVVNGNLILNKTLIIKDSLIFKISDKYSSSRYPNAKMINGTGKFIIPGLWDMHFHLCWEDTNDSLLFKPLLSYGITGVRDMGGNLSIQNDFKKSIKMDPTHGPEIYGAGPIIDGNPPVFYDITIPVDERTNIEHILDSTISLGSDFIKTYSLIKESELVRISRYSKEYNVPFAGHLSEFIKPETSIKLGQKSIEHLNVLDEIWLAEPARIDTISTRMLQYDSWLCPTAIIYDKKARISDSEIEIKQYNDFIPSLLMQEWISSRERQIERNKDVDSLEIQNKFESQLALLRHIHNKGVNMLAGSDFGGMPFVYPGIGLHEELILLKKAGLSNAEVLATATINPARYLSMEDTHGSVSEGKIADLVLLDKNPLENIKNTQTILAVIRKGNEVKNLIPTTN